MTRRTTDERGLWVVLSAAALAMCWIAPLAVAQEEDEDEQKEERSAVMVFERSDSQGGDEGGDVGKAFMVTVGPDGGSSVKMFAMQDGKMVPVDGGGHMAFVADGDGPGPRLFGSADFLSSWFGAFKEDHPTADANEDGDLSIREMRAFRVAKAMANSDAVLAQFPHADGNDDGSLDVEEAAQFAGPGLRHPPSPMARMLLSEDAPHGRIEIHDDEADGESLSMNVSIQAADIEFGDDMPHEIKIATRSVVRKSDGEHWTERVQTVDPDGLAEMTLTVDGEELYHGPSPASWLDEMDLVEPTREEVAGHMILLEEADSARFLEMHPDVDSDGDGLVSDEERLAFQSTFMAQMLEPHDWSPERHEDGAFEMQEHHRAIVEEVLRAARESEEGANPNVRKAIEEALARARGAHGDVKAGSDREKDTDSWVTIKNGFVRKHDFPKEAMKLADEVCAAAVKVRDEILEQIDSIKAEHADLLAEESERANEREEDLEAVEEGDRDEEKVAESKPARLIRRLEAKIEEIKLRRLLGGLEKIREKVVR